MIARTVCRVEVVTSTISLGQLFVRLAKRKKPSAFAEGFDKSMGATRLNRLSGCLTAQKQAARRQNQASHEHQLRLATGVGQLAFVVGIRSRFIRKRGVDAGRVGARGDGANVRHATCIARGTSGGRCGGRAGRYRRAGTGIHGGLSERDLRRHHESSQNGDVSDFHVKERRSFRRA